MAPPEPADIAAAFARASLLHQQGRLADAAPLYQVVLAADPYEAVALLSKSVPGVIVLAVVFALAPSNE